MKKQFLLIFALALLGASAVFGQQQQLKMVANITELRRQNPGDIHKSIWVLGKTTAGDGGGGLYVWDATTALGDDGGTYIQANSTSIGRWVNVNASGTHINAKRYLKGDGTEEGAALQAAVNYANQKTLYFPPGTYKSNQKITLPASIRLLGESEALVALDFTTGPIDFAMEQTGTLTALPNIAVDILKGATSVTFSAAHNLAISDLFMIHNTNYYSFGKTDAGQAGREQYQDGEYMEVSTVLSSTAVTLKQPTFSSYSGSTNKLWKVTPVYFSMEGMSAYFRQGIGNIAGLKIILSKNSSLRRTFMTGSQHSQIYYDRGYGMRLEEAEFFDTQASIGNNYGAAFGNAQKISIINCRGETTRHVFTFGGGGPTTDGVVPNRDINIDGGFYGSIGKSWAFDFHGNVEHYKVANITAVGGLVIAGDNFTIVNNDLANWNESGYGLGAGEMIGLNGVISGNRVYAVRNFDNGLISVYGRTNITRQSVLTFENNYYDLGTFTNSTYPSGITAGLEFGTIGALPNSNITVNIIEPTMRVQTTNAGPIYGISYITSGSGGIRKITIDSPHLNGSGIRMVRNAEDVQINDPDITKAPQDGIRIVDVTPFYTNQNWVINGGKITESMQDGVEATGTTNTWSLTLRDLDSRNNGVSGAGFYSARISGVNDLTFDRTYFGDDRTSPAQAGTYSAGTVTTFNLNYPFNVGRGKNALTHSHSAIQYFRDTPPLEGLIWDWDTKAYGYGTTPTDYRFLLSAARHTNAYVVVSFQNHIAAGNTSAGIGATFSSGEIGTTRASGFLGVTPKDGLPAYRAGMFHMEVNSDANGIGLFAPGASQEIKLASKSTTIGAGLNGSLWYAGSMAVNDDAFSAGWDGSTNVPTKNAIYDQITTAASTAVTATSTFSLDNTLLAADGSATRRAKNTGLGVSGASLNDLGANSVTLITDEAYDPTGWDSDLGVPTKNATRDQFVAVEANKVTAASAFSLANLLIASDGANRTTKSTGIGVSGGSLNEVSADSFTIITDEAYDVTGWDGDLSVPSKNAIRDKIETLGGGGGGLGDPGANGVVVRTALNTTSARTITGTANEVSVADGNGVSANPTISLPADISLAGKTSFRLIDGSGPTTDAAGETAFDNNAWAASRGAVQVFDGTANTYVVAALASDTPANGETPVWNTDGTVTWEANDGGYTTPAIVTTTDGTLTPVINVSVPADSMIVIHATVDAIKSDASQVAHRTIAFIYQNDGGTLASSTSYLSQHHIGAEADDYVVDASVSGTTATVNVQNNFGSGTVKWKIRYKVVSHAP